MKLSPSVSPRPRKCVETSCNSVKVEVIVPGLTAVLEYDKVSVSSHNTFITVQEMHLFEVSLHYWTFPFDQKDGV